MFKCIKNLVVYIAQLAAAAVMMAVSAATLAAVVFSFILFGWWGLLIAPIILAAWAAIINAMEIPFEEEKEDISVILMKGR